jgi:CHAT domain-containing protein
VGLQRAFLYAGTPAVVTTLWKVDDRASYELMREFPQPFAWAAFGLTGVPW